jgi:hypothetical protein
MDVVTGGFPAHPTTMTRIGSDFTIQGHGVFEDTQGAMVNDALDKALIQGTTIGFFYPYQHLNSRRCERLYATPGDEGIGIYHSHHYFRHASSHESLRTGGRSAIMVARFETDINRRAFGTFPRSTQSKYFGVGLSRTGMKTLTDNFPISDNYRPYHWIRCSFASSLFGKHQTPLHHLAIECCSSIIRDKFHW